MPWWESNPKLAEIAKFSIIEELTIKAREIGRGSYGTVYAALHSGKPCVAKETHPFLKHKKLEIFVREINILSTLKHPSIVQFLGVYFKDRSQTPILVMEMMWKNLCDLLQEQPDQLFSLTKANILYDVACGLQYLHGQKKPVVHRDLHPSNILVNTNFDAKIADLGQAKPLDNELAMKLSTAPGNIFYSAPEALKKNPTFNTKLDVFSLGCTIIHLVTEKFPAPTDQYVESHGLKDSFQKVSEANRRIEFLNLMKDTPVLRHIAYQSLEDAPANRPNASYICDELKKYIHQLESEAPELAKQHNKDKFTLLKLLQSQEKQLESNAKLIEDINKDKIALNDSIAIKDRHISSLESQCKDYENKLEESELTILNLNRDTESLQQQLIDLNKVNKDLTATYEYQEDLLRESLKTKQEIKATNEKEINNLQDKLREGKSILSQKIQLVSDLENDMQKIKADAEDCKQERDQLFKTNSEYGVKIKHLEQQIDQLQSKLERKDMQIKVIATEKDNIIADLNEKQNETEVFATTYKSQVDQLREEIKTKQDEIKHLAIKNEALKLKLSESETEIINLKDQIRTKQEELDKGTRKIEILEQAVNNSTNNELEFRDSFVIDGSSVNLSSEMLGSGSYSMIYAAQYHGKECAAKIAHSRSDKNFQRSFREECKLLVTLRHPCIIQLVGIFFRRDDPTTSPVILMERMCLSLTKFLTNKRSIQDKLTILHDVTCGLRYIHSKNIIHCNLTGNNILLTNNMHARIADFGQAVIYDPNSKDSLPTNPGNVHHMPPEASQHNPTYSTKLDVFSFGCIVIHTVTQEFPIVNCDVSVETSKYERLTEVDRRSDLIKKLKPVCLQLHKIVMECLEDHPDNRPTATILHLQLKNCTEKYSEVGIHERSKASFKGSTSIIQKRVKHSRSLYGLRQKSYKFKYNGYNPKRRDLRSTLGHPLILTESADVSKERRFHVKSIAEVKSVSSSNTFASVQPANTKKPEMDDINRIVVPRINAIWEDVAYALKFAISHVQSIKAKCGQDHVQCCKELFKDWLSTDKGLKPKTWSTLLQKLDEISDIAAATEEIKLEITSQV